MVGRIISRKSWPSSLNSAESSMFVGKLMAVPSLGLLALMIGTVVRLLQKAGGPRYWLFLAGSALSVITLFIFNIVVTERNQQRIGFLQRGLAFCLLIPYSFGCYLFFYEGLWRLLSLTKVISARTVIAGSLFTVLGYMVVMTTYRSTEFSKKVREGDILLFDK
jgi:hypothetical protein